MKNKNKKLIFLVLISCLFVGSFAMAKNFTIYNATNINLPYFSVNGTTGNVGIGLTGPTTPLQLLNNSWISAQNNLGTGTINMFKVNANNQIEVGAPLNIGSFEFSPDSGLVTFVDMPVTSASIIGMPQGYVLKLDGDNIMTIYSESNGAGGIQNKGIGIGTMTPKGMLDVLGGLSIGAYAGVSVPPVNGMIISGNIGIGTTAPNDKLSIGSSGVAAPLGSPDTGHNYTSTYLTADDYALTNYGLVKTLIGSATSSMATLWGGTTATNIWSLNTGNVGIGTTTPTAKLSVTGLGTGVGVVFRTTGSTNSPGLTVLDSGKIGNRFALPVALFQTDTLADAQYADDGTKPTWRLSYSGTPVIDLSMGNSYQAMISNPYSGGSVGGLQFRTGGLGTAFTRMTIAQNGNVSIGATTANDIFSIANGGTSAPLGSVNTGHNYTSTYLSTDDYALVNYGLIKTLIASATSSSALFGGTIGGDIWNLNANNVGIGTTTPLFKFDINGTFRASSANISTLGSGVVMSDASGNLYATSTLPYGYATGVGVFVGASATSTTGTNNGNPGYDVAYSYCENDYANSHVCTPDEMLNSIRHGAIYPTVNVWIFSGPPGYTASANDCNGRRGAAATDLGAYWEGLTGSFPKGRGLLMACNQSLKIACCK